MFARGLGYNTYVYTSFATCIVIIVYYNFIINIKVHDCKGKSCLEIFRISPKSLSLAYTNPSTKIQHFRINSKMRHPFDIENEEENIRGRIYLIVNWKMNLHVANRYLLHRTDSLSRDPIYFLSTFLSSRSLSFQIYKKRHFDLQFSVPSFSFLFSLLQTVVNV